MPGNTVTLDAVDSGWYDNTGFNSPFNQNYLVGRLGANTYNDWFVFNVPVFSGSIVSAELILNCYTNVSPYGQETCILRQVATSISALEAGGSGLTNIYNDLGDGGIYGIRNVFVVESGQRAIIPLNVQFFNDATAASGSQIALGGSIANLDPTNNRYLFGGSYGYPADVQLRLTFGTNLVINSANSGWYDSTGNHTASNPNYVVGDYIGPGTITHNYFVFNLPGLSSQLVDAELLLNSYTGLSPTGFETYQLYDVTNSIIVLTNNASGATNIYADLGSGVVYGGRNVYVSESGFIASIPLNGRFVAAAQANSGGRIALGGALTSLNPAPTLEYLFGFSSGLPTDAQLWLGFIAAPSSHPSFTGGTPTYLGNNQFQLTVSGTTGTTNEIQGSFDFQNWDFIRDVVMTGSTTSFVYTNNTVSHTASSARNNFNNVSGRRCPPSLRVSTTLQPPVFGGPVERRSLDRCSVVLACISAMMRVPGVFAAMSGWNGDDSRHGVEPEYRSCRCWQVGRGPAGVRPSAGAATGFLQATEHFPTTARSTWLRPGLR